MRWLFPPCDFILEENPGLGAFCITIRLKIFNDCNYIHILLINLLFMSIFEIHLCNYL